LKVLAKAPLTARSRPLSKLSRRPKDLPVYAGWFSDDVSRLTAG
jgi:hypothetical protein